MSISRRVFGLLIAFTLSAVVRDGAQAMDVNLPAGSVLDGKLQQDIDTKYAQDGQRFTLVTSAGSVIRGHLSQVVRANVGRKAHVTLNVDTIRFTDGTSAALSADVIGIEQKKTTNVGQAIGTVVGAMIVGNILGKAVGTNAGGIVGVAGGALLAANTSQNIVVPAGSGVRMKLTAPLVTRQQAR
jgi:hypothetical protein